MKYRHVAAMAAGFALDAALGDPQGWPHPVRLVGKQIDFEEGLIRKYLLPEAEKAGSSWPLDRDQTEQLAGAALAADVALVAPVAALLLLKVLEKAHPVLALAGESVLCYQLLAARSLCDESMKVKAALESGDLQNARHAVSMIVGRDTDELDEEGVAKAAVETVAENASDGVIAPLVYMGLGGAPAAMAYKAVNTLDSMVGYKNDRYMNLGRIPAKLDDVVNIVPSRVAGVLMCAAAPLVGMDGKHAWSVFKRDRYKHSSPNSAHTEAACAGALGVQLGGPNKYFGKVVEKPTIGDDDRPVEASDIERANKLMYATALLGLALAAVVGIVGGSIGARKG
ncbi:MAG: cobalamin biosynthesis protein CobD [Eggerthellaceae bacterium]|nr:cobalamin biosynthesis protein CobD [Eggerthellaceae bacterium]